MGFLGLRALCWTCKQDHADVAHSLSMVSEGCVIPVAKGQAEVQRGRHGRGRWLCRLMLGGKKEKVMGGRAGRMEQNLDPWSLATNPSSATYELPVLEQVTSSSWASVSLSVQLVSTC